MIGIPMGTNCAPLLADLFLHSYNPDLIDDLIQRKVHHFARNFNLISVSAILFWLRAESLYLLKYGLLGREAVTGFVCPGPVSNPQSSAIEALTQPWYNREGYISLVENHLIHSLSETEYSSNDHKLMHSMLNYEYAANEVEVASKEW